MNRRTEEKIDAVVTWVLIALALMLLFGMVGCSTSPERQYAIEDRQARQLEQQHLCKQSGGVWQTGRLRDPGRCVDPEAIADMLENW